MKTLIPLLAIASLAVAPALAQTTEGRSNLSDQLQLGLAPMVSVTRPESQAPWPTGLPAAPAVKLPDFLVHLSQSRPLDPGDVCSVIGGERFEILRHPGLALPILAKLNLSIADELFRGYRVRENAKNLNEIAFAMDRGGDAKEASYIRKSAQDYSSQSRPWQFFGAAGNGGLLSGLIFGN